MGEATPTVEVDSQTGEKSGLIRKCLFHNFPCICGKLENRSIWVTVIVEGALLLNVMDAPTGSNITDFSNDEYLQFFILIALNYVIFL